MKFHLDINAAVNVDVDPKPKLGEGAVRVAILGNDIALAYSNGILSYGRGLIAGANNAPLESDDVLYTEGYGQGRKLREESGL